MSASRAIHLLVGETEKADSSQGLFLVLGSVLKLWNVANFQMCKGTFEWPYSSEFFRTFVQNDFNNSF